MNFREAPDDPFDPYEATLGLRHRDIVHMLEILSDPQAPRANKIKALRLLDEVLPGRQHEADMHGAIDVLRPYLMQPPNGLLLNTIVVLNTLINTEDLARKLLPDVPRIVEIVHPSVEPPLRRESAKLLRIIAELVGCEPTQFREGSVPAALAAAVGSRESEPAFLFQAYGFLSRLTSKQQIRGPLIESADVLTILVRSFSNPMLRNVALMFAAGIAMDPLHRGKAALLNADILPNIADYLAAPDSDLRYAVLSLIALLAVPKEGKEDIAADQKLPDLVNGIIANDKEEKCREAAKEVKVLVSELPFGRAIMARGDE
jgi:hypothetical protein